MSLPKLTAASTFRFGSLFSGVGGLDLGLERSGMQCAWQVENDKYATKVLEKHWPNVRRWDDVRTSPPAGEWECDLICGGFPCQGISEANHRGKGLEDERSGLWVEFARILRVIRPTWALLENVSALTWRGLGDVLRDLSESGFDAEWQTLPAQAFGAPHERERVFIVAYSASERCQANEVFARGSLETASTKQASRIRHWPGRAESRGALPNRVRWMPDSELCRVVDGLPDELDRYRVLGNAVVPQVAQWLGERIMEVENAKAN